MRVASRFACLGLGLIFGGVSARSSEHLLRSYSSAGSQEVIDSAQTSDDYQHFSHSSFPNYRLRTKSPKLCDPTVKQHSGYLDVSEDKHIFFWFFEARNKPEEAPLVIWLNGGPGCSSSLGLFFALGPCRIGEDGKNTTLNKHSWNTNANMLFIDQPAGVGYSYNDGPPVADSYIVADDMWAFLQLFYKRFDEYSGDLHVAGESYGGTYIPHIARAIHENNRALDNQGDLVHINLTSILLGNGMTDPYYQYGAMHEWYCNGKWKVLEKGGPACLELKQVVESCKRLIQVCYDFDSDITCASASVFCLGKIYGMISLAGLNPYDARMKCDSTNEESPCYVAETWITTFLNRPDVKREVGVPNNLTFATCNSDVQAGFMASGDPARSSSALLPELTEDGLRVLVYVGDADLMCPSIGQILWLENLNTTFQQRFVDSPRLDFRTHNRTAGFTKSSGGKDDAGRIAYVEIYNAGHMAPHDQPDAALDMFNRWIEDRPLSDD
ncbi:peptidase S10 serine carboxypeptidase [Ceratobasidium sp. AG-I]|nr:peptidase S10 serine carboxypeptidase [Ceratobasidium sp. AG-I]